MQPPAANGISKAAPPKAAAKARAWSDKVIKDYWFDWRNYNPNTTVYAR